MNSSKTLRIQRSWKKSSYQWAPTSKMNLLESTIVLKACKKMKVRSLTKIYKSENQFWMMSRSGQQLAIRTRNKRWSPKNQGYQPQVWSQALPRSQTFSSIIRGWYSNTLMEHTPMHSNNKNRAVTRISGFRSKAILTQWAQIQGGYRRTFLAFRFSALKMRSNLSSTTSTISWIQTLPSNNISPSVTFYTSSWP